MQRWWEFPPLRNALLAGLLAGSAFVLERTETLSHAQAAWAFVAAIPLGGWHWIREGVERLVRERNVGIEILMMAATAGAGVLGLWDEAAALVVLYGAAEGTEELTYTRTRHAIRALMNLAPKEAQVLRDGRELTIGASDLAPGDRFFVRPGESVATDGIVAEGRSSVDEAPVTGESVPVDKLPGDRVLAGTINREGSLVVEATRAFADNTLSRIIHLVEEAQERKGRAQQWIERFGRRYSPAVLATSILLVLVPWLLGLPVESWADRAVVLLVAAAPCALVMSMPMAMAAGIGSAGRRGILIKGGAHLEHLGSIRVVALDKTGTLTAGQPVVTDVAPIGIPEPELLASAAAVERHSQHPLARAIVTAAEARGLRPPTAEGFLSMTGAGARASVNGAEWIIGSQRFFETSGMPLAEHALQIQRLQEQGKTVVAVAAAGIVRGLIAMQDVPRPEARAAVAALHALGIRTVMLTGDNARTGRTIANGLGIDDVRADLKPEDKVRAIEELQRSHGPVLMVGDGVNDAPALASATCGVAMGVAGTDAAIEAADVALMKDDLMKLVEALAGGRKARRVSLQNIVLSIGVLVAMIPLAVTGIIGVAFAVIVHEAAELIAVANGLRAGRIETAQQG